MKRLAIAVLFATAATAALAQSGKPYEQLDIDRALPNVPESATTVIDNSSVMGSPYEETFVDRALPNLPEERSQFASSGATRSDMELAVDVIEESPWAHDHNFVAPPQ